ncbi:hypothetical protein IQ22_04205 [Pseudomonas duriflava]|uniref:Uncharacterized protein n=1 Tax=Pseudomonas duriflava TaxID=459528 RepID=A0A562PU88_9PSED|nr:hypothetical protein [Pseudomonas duriflava]TWI48012.1 hypothetical protein IQ22_04205 [Pseudomonas duriflava]
MMGNNVRKNLIVAINWAGLAAFGSVVWWAYDPCQSGSCAVQAPAIASITAPQSMVHSGMVSTTTELHVLK